MANKYYVYLHIKLSDGTPFYVGKGKGQRATHKFHRSNWWNNIVSKHGYDIIFLEENLTEEEALKRELYWIKRIGRKDLGLGTLVNLTDGGDGVSGRKMSDFNKERLRLRNIGRIVSTEARNKQSESINKWHKENPEAFKGDNAPMFGKKHSKDTKLKMSNQRRLEKHPLAKNILDLETGIYYLTYKECADAKGIIYSTFNNKLRREEYPNLQKL